MGEVAADNIINAINQARDTLRKQRPWSEQADNELVGVINRVRDWEEEVESLRAELARLRPEPEEAPQPKLYRIIWWQSLVQGMTDGQTLEENVTREQVPARIAYHRIGLAGAIGVMIDAAPMSFVPSGDKKDE